MGRQGKGSVRPSAMDIDGKAGDDIPSDFEGVSGVSVSEDVGGVEAVSPPRPARKQKQKVGCRGSLVISMWFCSKELHLLPGAS